MSGMEIALIAFGALCGLQTAVLSWVLLVGRKDTEKLLQLNSESLRGCFEVALRHFRARSLEEVSQYEHDQKQQDVQIKQLMDSYEKELGNLRNAPRPESNKVMVHGLGGETYETDPNDLELF